MPPPRTPDDHRTKVIDMKLPLPWLLGSAAAIVMAFAYVSFSVDRMREDVAELRATAKAWNERLSTLTSDTALLKYRVDALEKRDRADQAGVQK
jgi:hypothetical protein